MKFRIITVCVFIQHTLIEQSNDHTHRDPKQNTTKKDEKLISEALLATCNDNEDGLNIASKCTQVDYA